MLVQVPAYTQENCLDYREIVFNKTDENGNALSEEKKAEIKEKAEKLCKKLRKDGTEDFFTYNALSESQGQNASAGGLYSCAMYNDTDTKVRDWCTQSDRKNGDIELIECDDAYRIVYFIKNIGYYWNYSIRNTKAESDYAKAVERYNTGDYAVKFSNSIDKTESEYIIKINKIYLGIKN